MARLAKVARRLGLSVKTEPVRRPLVRVRAAKSGGSCRAKWWPRMAGACSQTAGSCSCSTVGRRRTRLTSRHWCVQDWRLLGTNQLTLGGLCLTLSGEPSSDVAQGQAAHASSNVDEFHTAARAVDGNQSSYWAADPADAASSFVLAFPKARKHSELSGKH